MALRNVGDVTIDWVTENAGPSFRPGDFYPDWTDAHLEKHRHWMVPRCYHERTGRLQMSLHTWIIRTGQHLILVDTCVGNCKARSRSMWNNLQTPWLDRLAEAGVQPEAVDYVFCTHLHTDHVGWNTQLKDGRWIPTFPNAKYLMGKVDHDYWAHKLAENPGEPPLDGAFQDSVLPVVASGQALLVEEGFQIDDRMILGSAPGHTPGHFTMALKSKQDSALFIGDVMHHPIQVHEWTWSTTACEFPDQARASRRRVLESLADTPTLMLPAHFPAPHCGHVHSAGDGFTFSFAD